MQTITTPELSNAADRLLLDEVGPLLQSARVVAVVGAPEIAEALRSTAAEVRVHLDSAGDSDRVGGVVSLDEAVAGADVVVLRLPKSLEHLDDIAQSVALLAAPDVTLIAGGMLKYMTRSMNDVLARSFVEVRASLARQKARALFASKPLPVEGYLPRSVYLDEFDLQVEAWGGVFAGASLDLGTRAMLSTFDRLPAFDTAIDFGCGTGILAAQLKRARPSARVIASDDSLVATASVSATASANELGIEVFHESSLSGQQDALADLIVLNPPFHDGGKLSTDAAHAMFAAAGRVLKPGGHLWTVWNSHLGYKQALTRAVGPTTELTRTPKFTVTASTKQPR